MVQSQGNRRRSGLCMFSMGLLVGFFIASTVSLFTTLHVLSTDESTSLKIAHVALRALQSMRLFPKTNGWGMVHVYYGNNSHVAQASSISTDYYQNTQWFSQFHQDRVVSHLFRGKTDGYFVDLAANDAIRLSNTFALETYYNWTGICLEPNPRYWESLSYRKCDVVGAVVGDRNMEEVSFKYPNRQAPQGGIVGEPFDNKHPSKFGEDHLRFTVSLQQVFDRFEAPTVIDYLSLDVEGAEELILHESVLQRYQFRVITIERPSDKLQQLLKNNGYMQLKEIKRAVGEFLWVHKSMLKVLDMSALDIDTETYRYSETGAEHVRT